jgi:hypothetical protein
MSIPGEIRLEVATPCHVAWSTMQGSDRVRFCAACKRSVFNLTDMTSGEAAALLEDVERRPCVTYFQRADGTVLTADCPVGVSAARRRLAAAVAAAGALAAGLLVGSLQPTGAPRAALLARFITAPQEAMALYGGAGGLVRALWTGERPSLDVASTPAGPSRHLTVNKGLAVRAGGWRDASPPSGRD